MIGKVLGNRYRIMREVGSGGMAQVYLAEDNNDKELVAVKVLYPQFGEDLSYVQRFKREAKLASTLTDPHIVRVLDYGADRDLYYLVMEYIVGKDLREVLDQQGPFAWRDALETLDQLATALENAHEYGVVHRDIKPQNLMLDESGLLKVLDFGIARVDALPSLTQSGFVGSPYYVSPEQAMGENVDVRSDIYSSGIVLYELLSGQIPFDAKSPWSVISKHINSEPPPIDFSEDNVPKEVQQALERMIAKKPIDRFQTPTELRHAIATVLTGQGLPDNSELSKEPPPELADNFYQRGVEAVQSEEWGRATGLFSQALKLNPNHTDASEQLTQAKKAATLITQYNAARKAMENGFWQDALKRFEVITEINPSYKDVPALKTDAEKAYKQKISSQPIEERYNQAVSLIETAQWSRAIQILQEVEQLSPGYKDTERLLNEAKKAERKTTSSGTFSWVWVGIAVVVGILFGLGLFFMLQEQQAGITAEPTADHLKSLYQNAQQALGEGNDTQALSLLQQVADEDPNYADVVDLIRELNATATPNPEPTVVDELAMSLENVETALGLAEWSRAIELLNNIRSTDETYEPGRTASLFCDAYVGRGLDILNTLNITPTTHSEPVTEALADFEAGEEECPRRTDLSDQASRASAYLTALNTDSDDYDTLIKILNPIVAANPDYANGVAKDMLYAIYLNRGQQQPEIVKALSDYDAALALNVPDPSEAFALRSELLISGQNQDAPTPIPTNPPTQNTNATQPPPQTVRPTTAPLPTTSPILKPAPILITPNDEYFSGRFVEVYVEWEPAQLADDEYYDVTISYVFGDELKYWGTATRDSRARIPDEVGSSLAGNDRFNWWVTIRKENTAPAEGQLDQAMSLQSEIRWFIWDY